MSATEIVHRSHRAWTDERGRRYRVHIDWAVVGGRLRAVAMQVEAVGGHEVDTEALRRLPLGTFKTASRRKAAEMARKHLERPELTDRQRERIRKRLGAYDEPRPGQPPVSLEMLETVTAFYEEAADAGLPPTKTTHERLHEHGVDVSRSTVGKWVMRARDVGLLGPTEERKAGGVKKRRRKR